MTHILTNAFPPFVPLALLETLEFSENSEICQENHGATLHNRTVPSLDPEASRRPSGLKATLSTASE